MQTTPVHLGCNCELERIFLLSGAGMPFITIDQPFYTTIMINVQNLLDGKSEAISTYTVYRLYSSIFDTTLKYKKSLCLYERWTTSICLYCLNCHYYMTFDGIKLQINTLKFA